MHKHIKRTLDSSSADIADKLRQSNRGALHLLEGLRVRDGHGCLLDDLLVSALDRTVATEKRNGVAVLISEKLDLQVTRLAGELHDEDRRT